jgi:hypothetical protein
VSPGFYPAGNGIKPKEFGRDSGKVGEVEKMSVL